MDFVSIRLKLNRLLLHAIASELCFDSVYIYAMEQNNVVYAVYKGPFITFCRFSVLPSFSQLLFLSSWTSYDGDPGFWFEVSQFKQLFFNQCQKQYAFVSCCLDCNMAFNMFKRLTSISTSFQLEAG